MSLVFLTVLAGAGQGIFILLVILNLFLSSSGGLSPEFVCASGILSLLLPMLGVGASFLHLGHPMIGYKAIKMIKNSWLSREVVAIPIYLLMAAWYLSLSYYDAPDSYKLLIGVLGILAAFASYISSAMLYAAIRFVKEWSNIYTVTNFILFGLASGAAIMLSVAFFVPQGAGLIKPLTSASIILGLLSLASKILAYRHNSSLYEPLGIKNALGINDPDITMVDMGTTYDHYNTTEYSFNSEISHQSQRLMVISIAFALPIAAWMIISADAMPTLNPALSSVATLLMLGGLIWERRFFFIEGNHIQNLYYGNFKNSGAVNPLLSKSRPNHPAP